MHLLLYIVHIQRRQAVIGRLCFFFPPIYSILRWKSFDWLKSRIHAHHQRLHLFVFPFDVLNIFLHSIFFSGTKKYVFVDCDQMTDLSIGIYSAKSFKNWLNTTSVQIENNHKHIAKGEFLRAEFCMVHLTNHPVISVRSHINKW